jgi:hypothetical protein
MEFAAVPRCSEYRALEVSDCPTVALRAWLEQICHCIAHAGLDGPTRLRATARSAPHLRRGAGREIRPWISTVNAIASPAPPEKLLRVPGSLP